MSVIKYLMFFFNFLFWLSGLVLIVIGAVIRDKYGDYFSYADVKFANTAVFIIVVGVIVFVIGFFGCCGAVKENYCMVTTFAVLLAFIFILEIVAGALGFTYKAKVDDVASKAMTRAIKDYGPHNPATKLMDWTQHKFKCCGKDGASDYGVNVTSGCPAVSSGIAQGVPSCHEEKKCSEGLLKPGGGRKPGSGCKDSLINFIKENLVVIGGVAVSVAFIQLLGIIFACFLMKAIKGEYEVV